MRKILLVAVLLVACGVRKHIKAGDEAAAAGRDWQATHYYLRALGKKPEHEDARAGVRAVARDGVQQHLAYAEGLAQQGKYDDAADAYDRIGSTVRRLEGLSLLDFEVPDVEALAAEMRDAQLRDWFVRGTKERSAGRFQSALQYFAKVRERRPGYPELPTETARTWYDWGELAAGERTWRLAAERFTEAHHARPPFDDAADRAASLWASLGRHHVEAGACRQGVRDLRAAHELRDDLVDQGELDAAKACARVGIGFTPLVKERGDIVGLDVADIASQALKERIAEAGTEFVELDRPAAFKDAGKPHHFDVRGAITRAKVIRDKKAVERRDTADRPVPCPDDPESTCTEPVEIHWLQHTRWFQVSVRGELRIRDKSSGKLVTKEAVRERRAEASWAEDLQSDVGPVSPSSWTLPEELVESLGASREPEPVEAWAPAVIEELGAELGDEVLAIADVEGEWTNPLELPETSE